MPTTPAIAAMAKPSRLFWAVALSCISAPAIAQEAPAEPVAEPATESDHSSAAAAEAKPAPPPAETGAADLAKQLQNPISSLISVPFQMNMDFRIGPENDGVKSYVNIQPVIPISITASGNMISRTILPIVHLNKDVAGDATFGLGDTVQSFFFSPKQPTKAGIIWGAGPVVLLPTATDPLLGGQKWGVGPTFVALKQAKGWTMGVLANHLWSVAGKDSRDDVSATFVQPFLNYTWPSTFGVSVNTETTYNWETKHWTIPLNLDVSKIVHLGKQLASIQGGVRYYVERPAFGPNWGLRSTFTLLFPKRPKR